MQKLATEKGGKCLSKKYLGNGTNLAWQCADGHKWEATPGNIKSRGSWCPFCGTRGVRENLCREIFELIFKKSFPKKKPEWLMNKSKNLMELDGYNEKLGIAFEHHGEQHYRHTPFLRVGKKELLKRISDDRLKRNLCKQRGVKLVEIPFDVPVSELYQYIVSKCLKLKIKIPLHRKINIKEITSKYHQNNLLAMQKLAAINGGICLSNVYFGTGSKLKWQCAKGHQWEATPGNIRYWWCPKCSGKALLSIEEMQKLATSRGGKCLSKIYVNNHQKLKWECKKGHQWEAKPNDIKSGHWCPHCAGMAPLTIDEMEKIAESRGGKCLSKKYINGYTKLKWQCKNGHTWLASPSNIKTGGYWCPFCSGKAKHTIKEMRELAKMRSGKCLSTQYVNIYTKLKWQCDKKHQWNASAGNVLRGSWCPVCAIEKRRGRRRSRIIK